MQELLEAMQNLSIAINKQKTKDGKLSKSDYITAMQELQELERLIRGMKQ